MASGCIDTWWRTGIINYVVDSSSIEVDRRARRAKTDRLDLTGLLSLLARYVLGDRRTWRVVRVPTVAEEDARHLPRTLEALTQDRTRLMNRLRSLPRDAGRIARDRWAVCQTPRKGPSLGRRPAACRPAGATDSHVDAAARGGWTNPWPEGATAHTGRSCSPPRRAVPSRSC